MPPRKKSPPTDADLQLGLTLGPGLPPGIDPDQLIPVEPPPPPGPLTFTVSELTRRIQGAFKEDRILGAAVTVEGEVSNFKRSSRGHIYFTLKDANASLSCVMWASTATRQKFDLSEAMAVFATGELDIYAPSGSYSLVVKKLEPVGMGALQLAFLQLKEKLTAEGLFDDERKQPLPVFPGRVGIVTASTGAVIHDMLRVIRRKNRLVDVILAPVKVQGEGAATEIAAAITALQNPALGCEVLIVGRGGGSFEDLFCFSEEPVVRAIATSQIPIVAGIGHEPDFGLADAAADWSASTPTAAAEAAIPDVLALLEQVIASGHWLGKRLTQWIGFAEQQLERHADQLTTGLRQKVITAEHSLSRLHTELTHGMTRTLTTHEHTLAQLAQTLDAFSPLATLQRGYAIAQSEDGRQVYRHRDQLSAGQTFLLRLSDGSVTARMLDKVTD